MAHYLYILRSQIKQTYYTGVSNNPDRRRFFHNTDSKGYTRRFRPWELSIIYDSKSIINEIKIVRLRTSYVQIRARYEFYTILKRFNAIH